MYQDPNDLAEWYFVDQDRTSGPVSKRDLLQLVADHKLDVDCLVWREGLRDWVPFYQTELMAPLPFQSELMAPPPPPQDDWRAALANPQDAWRSALGALGKSQAVQTHDDDALYRRKSVVITPSVARFGDASFPISGITSVRIKSARRVEWAVAGLMSVGAGVISVFYHSPAGIAGFVVGTLLLGMALNSKHKLVLRTAIGEQKVYAAYSKSELREIMRAIEYSLTTRA